VVSKASLPSGLATAERSRLTASRAGDRRAAGTVKDAKKRAPAAAPSRIGMGDGRERIARGRIVGAGLDGDDALPDRRQKIVDREHRGRGVGKAEPLEARERKQGGVDHAVVGLRRRVAHCRERHHLEIAPQLA
jgi:hypothetical protein